MISKPLATALAWAKLASGLHIDHAHLQLKLQAIEAQTHCQVENAKLNGDIYPKRLCLRAVHELVDGAPVEDVYESNPEYASRVWLKNPLEPYSDCFCDSELGFIELASTGECIHQDDCATEFQENCPDNEEYGLFISDEPYCKGYLDLDQIRNNPDIFDEIMDKIFGTAAFQMNWMDMFTPASFQSQFNSMFDDACNEPESAISQYCNYKFASSGLVNVYNSISAQQQDKVRKLVLKQSFTYSKSAIDSMKLQRGCHCKAGYGRAKESSMKYFIDHKHADTFCYNQCIPETDCGKEVLCTDA